MIKTVLEIVDRYIFIAYISNLFFVLSLGGKYNVENIITCNNSTVS